jgi:serpin B
MKRFLVALLIPLAVAGTVSAEPGREYVGPVVGGSNNFATELFARLRETDGNLVFSPYALSSSLAMTSAGMRGQTLETTNRVVHLRNQRILHPAYRAYNFSADREMAPDRGFKMTLVSDLRSNPRGPVPFREDFIALTRDNYAAGPDRHDLVAASEIRVTRGDAPDDAPVEPDFLGLADVETARPLMLTSESDFRPTWSVKPTPESKPLAFTLADGKQVQTPMMKLSGRFAYAETDSLQMVEIPYSNRSVRIIFLLSKKAGDLASVEKSINIAMLPSTLNRVAPRDVDLTLPNYRIANERRLRQPLTQLGLGLIFTTNADFRGLSDVQAPVYLFDVTHRCGVDFGTNGLDTPPPTRPTLPDIGPIVEKAAPVNLKLDRPFLFIVRDADYGNILYMGRFADPTR